MKENHAAAWGTSRHLDVALPLSIVVLLALLRATTADVVTSAVMIQKVPLVVGQSVPAHLALSGRSLRASGTTLRASSDASASAMPMHRKLMLPKAW